MENGNGKANTGAQEGAEIIQALVRPPGEVEVGEGSRLFGIMAVISFMLPFLGAGAGLAVYLFRLLTGF